MRAGVLSQADATPRRIFNPANRGIRHSRGYTNRNYADANIKGIEYAPPPELRGYRLLGSLPPIAGVLRSQSANVSRLKTRV